MEQILESLEDPELRKHLAAEKLDADAEDRQLELARRKRNRTPILNQPVQPRPNAVAIGVAKTLYRDA